MSRQPTVFEQRVYTTICRIPVGKVSTYANVAKLIGCGSNQAVGQALKRNPFAPQVPCHRVVRTDLTLGGFNGQTEGEELVRKRRLLEEEGVVFQSNGAVDLQCVYAWPSAEGS